MLTVIVAWLIGLVSFHIRDKIFYKDDPVGPHVLLYLIMSVVVILVITIYYIKNPHHFKYNRLREKADHPKNQNESKKQ